MAFAFVPRQSPELELMTDSLHVLRAFTGTAALAKIANPSVVWMGHKFPDRLPLKLASNVAAAVFLALAIWVAWYGIG